MPRWRISIQVENKGYGNTTVWFEVDVSLESSGTCGIVSGFATFGSKRNQILTN